MGLNVLPLNQIFQKVLQRQIEYELLMRMYQESLKEQYRSGCMLSYGYHSQKIFSSVYLEKELNISLSNNFPNTAKSKTGR